MPLRYLVRLRQTLIVTSMALLWGCKPAAPPLTPQEKQFVQNLTSEMTPRCIGRYLIDLPKPMKINDQHRSKIEDVLIHIEPMSQRGFEYMLVARESELTSMSLDGQPGVPFLKKIEILPAPIQGKVFNRAESQGGSDAGRTLELHAWKNTFHIRMEIEAVDSSDPKYDNDPGIRSFGNDTPDKLERLLNLLSRTTGRQDDEIPTTPGTCIPSGFISGPATFHEEIGVAYELAEDVWLGFDVDSGISEETTLLDRSNDIEWGLRENEGSTVRKGKRNKNGITFEEWLSYVRTNDRIMGHYFTLEANSKIGSPKTPLLNIDFHNGLRAPRPKRPYDAPFPPDLEKASLSEAEAVALWDTITNTLRPRPGAF